MVRVKLMVGCLGLLAAVALFGPLVPQLPSDAAGWAAGPVSATPAATPEAAPFVVVEIVGRDYEPKGIAIDVGTTVYWVNRDGNAHTATDPNGAFDSGNLSAGAVYAHTFDQPGRYAYICEYHLDMGGSVTVSRSD